MTQYFKSYREMTQYIFKVLESYDSLSDLWSPCNVCDDQRNSTLAFYLFRSGKYQVLCNIASAAIEAFSNNSYCVILHQLRSKILEIPCFV